MVHKAKKIKVAVPHTVMKQSVNVRVNVPDKVRRRRTKNPAGFSGRGGGGSSGSVASLKVNFLRTRKFQENNQ